MSPFLPDYDDMNADWTKRAWDIDAYSPEQLLAILEHDGMTPAEFKELPVYKMNVGKIPWLRDFDKHRYQPQHIMLKSGRWVTIRELEQGETYEGLMAGYPTHEDNSASWRASCSATANATTPCRTSSSRSRTPRLRRSVGRRREMPDVICVARLDSRPLRRDPGGHGSELRVIWLQQRFAFPINPEALAQIRAIEWERQARSYRL